MHAQSQSQRSSTLRGNRLILFSIALGTAFLVVLLSAWSLLYAHSQVTARVEANTLSLAKSIRLSFESKIEALDIALQAAADEINRSNANGVANEAEVTDFLNRQMTRLPKVILRASNPAGDVIFQPGNASKPVNIQDRDYFIHLRAHPEAGLFVSEPVIGRIDGKWIWLFARRISQADGSFGGVVLARLDVDDIVQWLQTMQIDAGGSITMRAANRKLIAGHLDGGAAYPDPVGSNTLSAEFTASLQSKPMEGSYTHSGGADGLARTFSYSRSPSYGFYVNVATTGQSAFAHWRALAWTIGVLVSIFLVLIGGSCLLIAQAWRRQHANLSALNQAQKMALLCNFRLDLGNGQWQASETVQEIFGVPANYPRDYAHWLALFAPQPQDTLRHQWDAAAQNAGTFHFDYAIERAADGAPRWVHVTGSCEQNAQAQTTALVGTVQDISERKLAELEVQGLNFTLEARIAQRTADLEEAIQKLQHFQEELKRSEARATISTLVASVSHELSTPIGNSMMVATTLKSQAETLQRNIDSGSLKRSDFVEFLQTLCQGTDLIESNLHRTGQLLNNFRQVAADQASEQQRVFDLRQVLDEIVRTIGPSLKRFPHRVDLRVPEGIRMNSLPGPLGQITINLINNAFLHAFEGREDGLVTVDAVVADTHVTLCFADNGCGIPDEDLDKVFQPYFSTKIGQGGTGLGLAIVINLITKTLRGTIEVQSAPSQGTRFEIRLPLVLPAEEMQADASAPGLSIS